MSAVFCIDCRLDALKLTYSVSFNVASAGFNVAWLDVCLHIASLNSLKWSMLSKELHLPPAATYEVFLRAAFIVGKKLG